MKRTSAFTLIELLIVVAIIAILAAIAVPNFLEAQTRAKVSAAKNQLRILATGLESYAVDHNKYPYAENLPNSPWLPPGGTPRDSQYSSAQCGGLTSPVAYLSSLPLDSFKHDIAGIPVTAPVYYERAGFGFDATAAGPYPNNPRVLVPADAIAPNSRLDGTGADTPVSSDSETPARYVLFSLGPDLKFVTADPTVKSRYHLHNRYDPTNGTVSGGNVLRFASGVIFP